jgi:hypothetical protein
MARPRLEIDPEQVKLLAGIGCPVDEMALVLGCSKRTLERRYAALIETGRADIRKSLRRKQVEMALKGDRTMLIWLGKQLLGQRDEQRVEHAGGLRIERDDEALEAAVQERLARELLLIAGDDKPGEGVAAGVLAGDAPGLSVR